MKDWRNAYLPLASRLIGDDIHRSPVCSSETDVTGDEVIELPLRATRPDVGCVLK